jgi:Fe-S-cluster-containing dehydrogenase component
MSVHFELDIDKCSACGACAVACMDQNDISIPDGERPFRCVFLQENKSAADLKDRYQYFSVACMHCDNAPCVNACPSGCLFKDPETGFTLFDTTNCIGCHSCAMACPFGAPAFRKDGKMQKCDGCIERVRHGRMPSCVLACPNGALQLITDGQETVGRTNMFRELANGNLDNYF